MLLASGDWAKARGLLIQAYLTYSKTAAVDFCRRRRPADAPTVAVARLLQDTGLSLQDFDYYEIPRKLSQRRCCALRAWESDKYCRERLGLAKALGSIDPTSSTSRAARFGIPAIHLPQPAARIVAAWPSCWSRKAAGAG